MRLPRSPAKALLKDKEKVFTMLAACYNFTAALQIEAIIAGSFVVIDQHVAEGSGKGQAKIGLG